MRHPSCVRTSPLALLAAFAVVLTLPLPSLAAEATRILSSFDEGDPFDIDIEVGFRRSQKRSKITHEYHTGEKVADVLALRYSEVTNEMPMNIRIGLFRDLELNVGASFVFSNNKQWRLPVYTDIDKGEKFDPASSTILNNMLDQWGNILETPSPIINLDEISIVIIGILIIITNKYWLRDDRTIPKFQIVNDNVGFWTVILVAFMVVIVRSFIAYAIPIAWKKELWQSFLLFFTMGIGKALGGILSDKWGARKVGVISTLLCIPFLLAGNNIMIVSIIGVFMFSLTMSITYGMIVNVLQENPGVAFGITTIGLFIGILPVFIYGTLSFGVNAVLIIVLSVLSACGLRYTLR